MWSKMNPTVVHISIQTKNMHEKILFLPEEQQKVHKANICTAPVLVLRKHLVPISEQILASISYNSCLSTKTASVCRKSFNT